MKFSVVSVSGEMVALLFLFRSFHIVVHMFLAAIQYQMVLLLVEVVRHLLKRMIPEMLLPNFICSQGVNPHSFFCA